MCVYIMMQNIFSRRLGLPFNQEGLGLWIDIGLETGGETGLVNSTVVTEVR